MDGFKRRLNASIRLQLSFWISAAILAVALIAGVFSFVASFDEAHELQDDVLRQVAALFDQHHMPLPHLGDSGRANDSDEEARVVVQYLSAQTGPRSQGDASSPLPLPATLSDGMHTLTVGNEQFRVLVKTLSSGERVAVAQETGIRDEIARDSALRTVMPFLILVPILLLLVANLVRMMLRPISSVAQDVDQRTEHDLHPIRDADLPVEVQPFITAINRLLGKVEQSMMAQRRFVADAAHELRSPLTALSLQAERLADTEMPDEARSRLSTLRQGIARGRQLLEQLLALAKVQSVPPHTEGAVSVQAIYRQVLEDVLPLAEAKQIDIGMASACDATLRISEADLVAIVRNLVDNAIRYTPHGGRIDLDAMTQPDSVTLRISDTGPGIPESERERVFDPFYRVLGNQQQGSGLGLSIVKTIATRIGATVRLSDCDMGAQCGLRVEIEVPIQAQITSAFLNQ